MADNIPPDTRLHDRRVVETRSSSTPGWLIAIVVIVLLVVAAFALGLVNIDQTQTAKLPDVNVETSGGQAPAFDVDTATVDVGSKKETVDVPTVDVGSKETSIDVPTVSVEPAGNPEAKD